MAGRAIGIVTILAGILWTPLAMAQERDCCDQIDDDGDGQIDFMDADCLNTPDCPIPFRRGDVDLDGNVRITDAILIFRFLFDSLPDPHLCDKPEDVDDDGSVDIADGIFLLGWLFRGGPAPPEPFLECGFDPTPDRPENSRCIQLPEC